MSYRAVPAIDDCYSLAEQAIAAVPAWGPYLGGVTETVDLVWSLPDATEADKTRWIALMLLSTAAEVSLQADKQIQEDISRQATEICQKHHIQEPQDEIDLDTETDITGISADLKVAVAAGIVVAFEKYRDTGTVAAIKERFNAHAAGIRPAEIPASLHRKMSETITALNHLAP